MKKDITTLLVFGLVVILAYINDMKLCVFRRFLGIRCPGCGLTRSCMAILKLNFIESLQYNILGIPLAIMVIVYMGFFLFRKVDVLENFLNKHKIIFISLAAILIIASFIINQNNSKL
jgi:hypothetical protein